MVWGAISSYGKLDLHFPTTRLNSKEYIGILEERLIPFIHKNKHVHHVFQQDNAPCHSSAMTKNWFREKKCELLEWPSLSPDLNIMENVWGFLVRKVYGGNRQYGTINELKLAINQAWNSIHLELIQKLFGSMPNRIFDLIECKGNPVNY